MLQQVAEPRRCSSTPLPSSYSLQTTELRQTRALCSHGLPGPYAEQSLPLTIAPFTVINFTWVVPLLQRHAGPGGCCPSAALAAAADALLQLRLLRQRWLLLQL